MINSQLQSWRDNLWSEICMNDMASKHINTKSERPTRSERENKTCKCFKTRKTNRESAKQTSSENKCNFETNEMSWTRATRNYRNKKKLKISFIWTPIKTTKTTTTIWNVCWKRYRRKTETFGWRSTFESNTCRWNMFKNSLNEKTKCFHCQLIRSIPRMDKGKMPSPRTKC